MKVFGTVGEAGKLGKILFSTRVSPVTFTVYLRDPQIKMLINHRAKRGGSLFQGGSGEREGSRSDPPCGGEAPTKVAKRPFVGGGVPFRSWVFY